MKKGRRSTSHISKLREQLEKGGLRLLPKASPKKTSPEKAAAEGGDVVRTPSKSGKQQLGRKEREDEVEKKSPNAPIVQQLCPSTPSDSPKFQERGHGAQTATIDIDRQALSKLKKDRVDISGGSIDVQMASYALDREQQSTTVGEPHRTEVFLKLHAKSIDHANYKVVAFIVDASYSMANSFESLKQGILHCIDILRERVNSSCGLVVVAYGSTAEVVTSCTNLKNLDAEEEKSLKASVNEMSFLGTTNFEVGFRKALEKIGEVFQTDFEPRKIPASVSTIFMTDGGVNQGTTNVTGLSKIWLNGWEEIQSRTAKRCCPPTGQFKCIAYGTCCHDEFLRHLEECIETHDPKAKKPLRQQRSLKAIMSGDHKELEAAFISLVDRFHLVSDCRVLLNFRELLGLEHGPAPATEVSKPELRIVCRVKGEYITIVDGMAEYNWRWIEDGSILTFHITVHGEGESGPVDTSTARMFVRGLEKIQQQPSDTNGDAAEQKGVKDKVSAEVCSDDEESKEDEHGKKPGLNAKHPPQPGQRLLLEWKECEALEKAQEDHQSGETKEDDSSEKKPKTGLTLPFPKPLAESMIGPQDVPLVADQAFPILLRALVKDLADTKSSLEVIQLRSLTLASVATLISPYYVDTLASVAATVGRAAGGSDGIGSEDKDSDHSVLSEHEVRRWALEQLAEPISAQREREELIPDAVLKAISKSDLEAKPYEEFSHVMKEIHDLQAMGSRSPQEFRAATRSKSVVSPMKTKRSSLSTPPRPRRATEDGVSPGPLSPLSDSASVMATPPRGASEGKSTEVSPVSGEGKTIKDLEAGVQDLLREIRTMLRTRKYNDTSSMLDAVVEITKRMRRAGLDKALFEPLRWLIAIESGEMKHPVVQYLLAE